jgi:hypothetical protein
MSGTLVAVAVSALAAIEEKCQGGKHCGHRNGDAFFMTIFQKFMEVLF